MTKLNKGIISPVAEHGEGYVFNAAGQNFKMTGSHVELFNENSQEFSNMLKAQSMFNVSESGLEFFYDFNNKTVVSELNEGSIENFDKTLEIEKRLEFLNETRKSISLKGVKGDAIDEVANEIKTLQEEKAVLENTQRGIVFKYDVENAAFYANKVEMLLTPDTSLTESIFAAGYIKYEDKALINLFEFAGKNFASFKILDFVAESIDGDVRVATIKTGHNVYVYRVNEATKISKFSKFMPDTAIEYVAEQTGADITYLVEDILESFAARREAKRNKIRLMHEMIAFLKDQKGRLAEADRNLPDIKAADNLINSEIARLSEELNDVQNEELLTVSDGYLNGTLKVESDDLAQGTEVKIDAVEYTQAAKDDILTVFVNDEPTRIEKYKIELEAGATV